MVNSAISITIYFQDWKIIKGFHYKILHAKRNTKCKELLQIIVWKTSMLNHTRQLSQTSRAVFRLNLPKLSPKLYFKLLLKSMPSGYRMFILLYQVTNKHDAFPDCLPVDRWQKTQAYWFPDGHWTAVTLGHWYSSSVSRTKVIPEPPCQLQSLISFNVEWNPNLLWCPVRPEQMDSKDNAKDTYTTGWG